MTTRIVTMLLFPAMIVAVAHSQPLEVSRISEQGILETLGLEVKFNCPVINPEQGVQYASLDDIAPEYEHIRTFLENLAGSYGEFQLVKQIPSAVWGDTLKPRASDGALVPVIDMSQLYLLHFSDYIPVEEVIEEFLKLSEIEYAHPPVEAVDLADPPNDPLYEGQWNLARIAAEDAWRITHGADNIRVAIIESNELPIRDHPDLINKWHPTIGEQGPGSGDHGTRVAGIIGAETNNEIGIASLARGLKMTRYFFLFPDLGLPNAINRAADSNRVINCSFLTVELHRIPGTDCTIRVHGVTPPSMMQSGMLFGVSASLLEVLVIARHGSSTEAHAQTRICLTGFLTQHIPLHTIAPLPSQRQVPATFGQKART